MIKKCMCIVLCTLLTGCSWMYYEGTPREEKPAQWSPAATFREQVVRTSDPCFNQVDWDSVPIFSQGEEEKLCAYVEEQFLSGAEQAAFLRKGFTGEPSADFLLPVGGFMQGDATWLTVDVEGENVDYVLFQLIHSAGMRILKAQETGDFDSLTEDERTVFHMALDFVENNISPEDTPLERERKIHDHICAITAYYDGGVPREPAPFQSSLGVFLDGRANCLGYSDAFYLLCSLAGLHVQSVNCQEMNHTWNLVELDGTWYLTDVTWDDGGEVPAYVYFNAGMDVVQAVYDLPAQDETHKISAVCDENFLYYGEEDAFLCLESAGEDVYAPIAQRLASGQSPLYVLVKGFVPTTQEVCDGITAEMAEYGENGELVTEVTQAGDRCFITAQFLRDATA